MNENTQSAQWCCHTLDETWDVIRPICLRGLFSVLNINIPHRIKAQHYSRTITSTTTKTIQRKCGQEQLTLPLFGNYVTVFCLCSRNLDKVFTLAKQTHFYRVMRKRACTIGHRWHMQYCTSVWGYSEVFFSGFFFRFALVNKVIAQVVSIPCHTTETRGRRPQSFIPLLLHRLLLAPHYYHHYYWYHLQFQCTAPLEFLLKCLSPKNISALKKRCLEAFKNLRWWSC